MTEANWICTEHHTPPQGVVVWTMNSGGNVQKLVLEGRLWWFEDRGMYAYYVPKFWKHIKDKEPTND